MTDRRLRAIQPRLVAQVEMPQPGGVRRRRLDGFRRQPIALRRLASRLRHRRRAIALCGPRENRDWGYDRIAGALANLGHEISDQAVGNVLHRHGLPPAPERRGTTTWAAFIRTHVALLAGTDSSPRRC
jgi:hypothetical protein